MQPSVKHAFNVFQRSGLLTSQTYSLISLLSHACPISHNHQRKSHTRQWLEGLDGGEDETDEADELEDVGADLLFEVPLLRSLLLLVAGMFLGALLGLLDVDVRLEGNGRKPGC